VPINCGAIPETLLESELFGHEKGAFTGADTQRMGRLELAQGGTIFLDEIGELTNVLQVKLLRFLQDHIIERVGGREPIPLDVRVVAATNRDLSRALTVGKFRQDLFYRISVVTVDIPALRERRGDIPMLADVFLERYRNEYGRPRLKGFTRGAQSAMRNYGWPGNVRELENKVRRAVIMAIGGLITLEDLGLGDIPQGTESALKAERDHLDFSLVLAALRRHRGRVTYVAEELGISRPTLNKILDRIGVEAKDFKVPKRRPT
jgi:two-component system NtrC family response regulator